MCPVTPLIVACPVLGFLSLFVTAVKGIIITFPEPNKPGCLLGENSDHFHCLRRPLLFNFVIFWLADGRVCVPHAREKARLTRINSQMPELHEKMKHANKTRNQWGVAARYRFSLYNACATHELVFLPELRVVFWKCVCSVLLKSRHPDT